MTAFEISYLSVSVLALLLSGLNTYWLFLRKGKVEATRPSQFSLRLHRDLNSTASIIIQTLVRATGKRKIVIDQLYVRIERAGSSQNFATWQIAGQDGVKHLRRTGLVLDSQGTDEAFMFFVTPGTDEYKFAAGQQDLQMWAKRGDRKVPEKIFATPINLTEEDLLVLSSGGALQFFHDPSHTGYVKLAYIAPQKPLAVQP